MYLLFCDYTDDRWAYCDLFPDTFEPSLSEYNSGPSLEGFVPTDDSLNLTSAGEPAKSFDLLVSDIGITFNEVDFFESSPPNDTTEVASHSYSDHGNNYADSSPSTTYDSTPTYSEPSSYDSGNSYDSSSSGGNSFD